MIPSPSFTQHLHVITARQQQTALGPAIHLITEPHKTASSDAEQKVFHLQNKWMNEMVWNCSVRLKDGILSSFSFYVNLIIFSVLFHFHFNSHSFQSDFEYVYSFLQLHSLSFGHYYGYYFYFSQIKWFQWFWYDMM